MATTTNYSWTTPDDTDLVKDGAAAIRSLGSAIDSTVFTNAGNAINKTIVDAKGDLITATAADTPARLAVGTNGQYLKANSSTATGLEWGDVSAGGMTELASGTLSGSAVNLTSISGSYKDLRLIIRDPRINSGGADLQLRFNNVSTSASYKNTAIYTNIDAGTFNNNVEQASLFRYTFGTDDLPVGSTKQYYELRLLDYANTTTVKYFEGIFYATQAGYYGINYGAQTSLTSTAINEINIFPSASTFSSGTYILYGVK
jgi:hypothetical protein